MKCIRSRAALSPEAVTPQVGVWIEIYLKDGHYIGYGVTPQVGVWIEIIPGTGDFEIDPVTPQVGVWIEIKSRS